MEKNVKLRGDAEKLMAFSSNSQFLSLPIVHFGVSAASGELQHGTHEGQGNCGLLGEQYPASHTSSLSSSSFFSLFILMAESSSYSSSFVCMSNSADF